MEFEEEWSDDVLWIASLCWRVQLNMVLWLRPPLTAPSRHIVPIKTSRRSSAADEKNNLGDKMRPGWVAGEARERKREVKQMLPSGDRLNLIGIVHIVGINGIVHIA